MKSNNHSIYLSNEQENLVKRFIQRQKEISTATLEPTYVVIQSLGMKKWLVKELTLELGIVFNYKFLFPNQFLSLVLKKIAPQLEKIPSINVLAWKIYQLLPAYFISHKEKFKNFQHYYKKKDKGAFFQLCYEIALVMDRHALYKSDEINNDQEWQSILWKRLFQQEFQHYYQWKNLLETTDVIQTQATTLPQHISFFGISYLPQLYLEIIDFISSYISCDFYYLSPCCEYWTDIVDEKKLLGKKIHTQNDEYFTIGNELLSFLGKKGQEFQKTLFQLGWLGNKEEELYQKKKGQTVLQQIQNEILYLQKPQKLPSSWENDGSCIITYNWNEFREVEVLYHNILDWLEKNPQQQPQDIIIMSKNIEEYAPHIDAVFNTALATVKIPFTITDKNSYLSLPWINCLLDILSFATSNFHIENLFKLLRNNTIKEKFAFQDRELEIIKAWFMNLKAIWGINNRHRKEFASTQQGEYTWQHALEKIFLGCALYPDTNPAFTKNIPHFNIDVANTECVEKFLLFYYGLVTLEKHTKEEYNLQKWVGILQHTVDTFFTLSAIDQGIFLQIKENLLTCDGVLNNKIVPFHAFTAYFEKIFLEKYNSHDFLNSGITFCNLQPMRSIPFAFVGILGMNEQNFPDKQHHSSLDPFLNVAPPLYPHSQKESLYLFLEIVLSVRDTLYISSSRSNASPQKKNYSICITYLLDYLQKKLGDELDAQQVFVEVHTLSGFDDIYFQKNSPFKSYSQFYHTIATEKYNNNKIITKNLQNVSEIPQKIPSSISLNEIIAFFKKPLQYFFKNSLYLELSNIENEFPLHDPTEISNLNNYVMNKKYFEETDNVEMDTFIKNYYSQNNLPQQTLTEFSINKKKEYWEMGKNFLQQNVLIQQFSPINVDLNINNINITGEIHTVTTDKTLITWMPSSMKYSNIIGFWIQHLFLKKICATANTSLLYFLQEEKNIKKQSKIEIYQCDESVIAETYPLDSLLEDILATYLIGIKEPLPLLGDECWSYAQNIAQGKKDRTAYKEKFLQSFNNYFHYDFPALNVDKYYTKKYFLDLQIAANYSLKLADTILLPAALSLKKNN